MGRNEAIPQTMIRPAATPSTPPAATEAPRLTPDDTSLTGAVTALA